MSGNPIDGVAASQQMLSFGTWRQGYCLECVNQAYKNVGQVSDGKYYPTAQSAWEQSGYQVPGDMNPPAGVPVYLGPKSSSSAGDVMISVGGGVCVATDIPGQPGVIGYVSIQDRMNQTGRPYNGWTRDFLGNLIIQGGAAPMAGNQRQVGQNPANQRPDPSTSSPATNQLAPGTIGTFDGWVHGENVQGQDVWFHGAYSGLWSWAGGFTDQDTHDLTDMNSGGGGGLAGNQRQVVAGETATQRTDPSTGNAAAGSWGSGAVVTMDGFTHGENVQGNDVWYREAGSGLWGWSGGFTDHDPHDLTDVGGDTPDPPDPPDPDNPRDLAEYAPIYPAAINGLEAPLGFTDCQNPTERTPRTTAGSDQHPVTPIIDRLIVHHTATPGNDQLDYFSYCNDRSSCPTWYMRTDGSIFETIRPGAKPASTGSDWNWRSVAIEILDADAAYNITAAQSEALSQLIAWLGSFDQTELDGVPVDFPIDREHVVGHRECTATECPGDPIFNALDDIVARAVEIAGGDDDLVEVVISRDVAESLFDALGEALE